MSKGQHQYATNYKQESMLRLSEEKILQFCSSHTSSSVRPRGRKKEFRSKETEEKSAASDSLDLLSATRAPGISDSIIFNIRLGFQSSITPR
jgi:hypothetical protein